MVDSVVKVAQIKLTAARAEVARLEAFLATYAEISKEAARAMPVKSGSPDNWTNVLTNIVTGIQRTQEVVADASVMRKSERIAVEAIRKQGRPIQSAEMLKIFEALEVEVGGRDPASTLSARLSRAPSLEFVRGLGWTVKGDGPPDEVASPSPEGKELTTSTETSDDAVKRGEVAHDMTPFD